MLSNLTHFTTAGAFNTILLATLRESEAAKPVMYLDNATPQNATIGIGFNLTNLEVVRQVLVGMGYVDGATTQVGDSLNLRDLFVARGPLSTMQREADQIIAGRLGAGRTFAFSHDATGEAAMNGVFIALAPTYTQTVVNRLNALQAPGFTTNTWSRELVALTSLAYNLPTLIGQGLANAIRDDNRALAWYEIRFASNRKRIFGLQNRRDRESDMFGLFETGGGSYPPSLDAAKMAYRVFTPRYSQIDTYLRELEYTDDAGRTISAISKPDLDTARQAFAAALDPGKEVLLTQMGSDYGFAFEINSYRSTAIYLDPGRVSEVVKGSNQAIALDPNHSTTLDGKLIDLKTKVETASNDILIGEGGDDHLVGRLGDDVLIGGTGSDGLSGGAGNDIYLFKSGDGADLVLDSIDDGYGGDGQGTLFFDGVALTGQFNQKNPDSHPGLYGNDDWNLNFTGVAGEAGLLVITRVVGGNDLVVIPNFRSGNLGITLGPEAEPTFAEATGNIEVKKTSWHDAPHVVVDGSNLAGVQLAAAGDYGEVWGNGKLLGNDSPNRLRNGDGDDELYGFGGKDTLVATGGNDRLYGGDDDDALSAGDGDDLLFGGTGSDVLAGGRGNDVLDGGDGDDYLFGGGDYTATRSDWSVTLPTGLGGWISFDQFSGVSYLADDGADVMQGGAGNDYLWGGEGADQLDGGVGNDQLVGDSENDYLFGGEGDDKLFGDGSQSSQPLRYTLPAYHGDDILDGGDGNDSLTGDGGSDELHGGDGDDILIGDADDLPIEFQGNDYLDGGAGNDKLYGYGKDDVLFGGSGDDTLEGDSSNVPYADHGNDYLDGGDGNDDLAGNGGDDILFGGPGDDLLHGDTDDTPVANQGNDYLDGEDGDDYLRGYAGDDILIGGAGQDQLEADAGDDVLDGGTGDDTLFGGEGKDTLSGGSGGDYLSGGAGDDTYLFQLGDGGPAADQTIDAIFEDGGNDTVRFEGVSAGSLRLSAANDGSVLLVEYGLADQLAIVDGVSGAVESFEIEDEKLTTSEFIGRYAESAMSGVNGSGQQVVSGGRGDDSLVATGAFATISGGRGNDTIVATGDNTTLLYSLGDGTDRVTTGGNGNVLRFGTGITAADLTLGLGSLALHVGSDPEDTIHFEHFNAVHPHWLWPFGHIEFSDGSSISYVDLLARGFDLPGTNGDDTINGTGSTNRITGGGGNDTLFGGTVNDTYIFNTGDGQDVIINGAGYNPYYIDTLLLGEGIAASDLVLRQVAANLLINIGATDSVTIKGYFATPTGNNKIDQIVFADTTVWDQAAIEALVEPAQPTDGDDFLDGLDGDDVIDGLGGKDTIRAAGGDDRIFGGEGNDLLYGGDGDDTLDGGEGSDVLYGGDGDDTLDGGEGSDVLYGEDGDDRLDGGAGNDTLYGGFGSDTYLLGRGSGNDIVWEFQGILPGDENIIEVQAGVLPGDVVAVRDYGAGESEPNSLRLYIKGTGFGSNSGDSLLVRGLFASQANQGQLARVCFADGTIWDLATIRARLDATTDNGDTVLGYAWDDVIDAQGGNDYVFGFRGSDSLSGGSGDDQLDGGDGNDLLYGGDGRDTLLGRGGDDTLDGGAGNDDLQGHQGSDTYVFGIGSGNDAALDYDSAGTGIDSVRIGSGIASGDLGFYRHGNDLVFTLTGRNDQLWVNGFFSTSLGGGNYRIEQVLLDGGVVLTAADIQARLISGTPNAMVGTVGDDIFFVDDLQDTISEAPGQGIDTVESWLGWTLGSNLENLTLTGPLNIGGHGNALDNVIRGNDGDNFLSGGSGADTLYGGPGNDTYYFDRYEVADVIIELPGEGVDTLVSFYGAVLPANVENLVIMGNVVYFDGSGAGAIGNSLDNRLVGNQHANRLDGGLGADTMIGGGGKDTFVVDNPGDVVVAAGYGIDTVESSISYTLGGTLGNLVLWGTDAITGTGNDLANILSGSNNSAANLLAGGLGDDRYILGAGDTVLEHPGEGNDTVQIFQGTASVYALAAYANVENLELASGAYAANILGNDADNVLSGNQSTNTLIGGAGNDQLYGGGGDDTLIGGSGDDSLHGGFGSDTFVFAAGDGHDALYQDEAAGGRTDVLRLVGLDQADITLTRKLGDNTLTLTIDATGETLRLVNFYASASNQIDRIEFASDESWSQADIVAQTVTVGGNQSPIVADPPNDQQATEGLLFAYVLPADTFADSDKGDILMLDATLANGDALPAWLAFDAATGSFSGIPTNDDVGTLVLTVTATDPAGASVSSSFSLAVANTNDAPVIANLIADQSANEDAAFSFALPASAFTDVDIGDSLTLSATQADGSALPAWLAFDALTGTFSGTPANGDVGDLNLEVIATDLAGASVSSTFAIAVANTNHAPVLANALAAHSASEGAAFSFVVPANAFADVDVGDVLNLSATQADGSALPTWLTFNSTTHSFSGTPANSDAGILNLEVTATDLAGASVSSTFTVAVGNTNDAPVAASAIADQTAHENAAFSFTVPGDAFNDIDIGDSLTLSVTQADGSVLPSWLAFDVASRSFSGTPANGDVGVLNLKLVATDVAGASASQSFTLAVASSANTAPVLVKAIADQAASEDAAFSFVLPVTAFADVDTGDSLTLSAALADGWSLPAWLTFDAATRTFTGTPANEHVGALSIILTATDTGGLSVADTFNLLVTNTNDAPLVANVIADQTAHENAAFNFTVPADAFIDIDTSDSLTLSVTQADGSALPSWLVFDVAARSFSGTPANGDVGKLTLKLAATDMAGVSASQSFSLTIGAMVSGRTLQGTPGGDTISGSAGDDLIAGGAGSDVLRGNGGDDTFLVSGTDSGFDRFEGGDGFDTVRGSSGDDTIRMYHHSGTATVERIDGGGGFDVIAGTQYGDTLDFAATELTGIARIDGGLGDDTINGSAGDDVIVGGVGSDVLRGNGGDDTFLVTGTDSGFDRFEGGDGFDTVRGSSGDDTIRMYHHSGTATVERIDGGGGFDVIAGTQYGDTLDFAATELTGIARIDGGLGDDTINGSAGDDVIVGGVGSDVLRGNGGDDTFLVTGTDSGFDRFEGGDGFDTVVGSSGDDTIRMYHHSGTATVERIDGGGGFDVIAGTQYADTLDFSATELIGIARIDGGLGDDTITGSAGDDYIHGGHGADRLYGLAGIDIVQGGDGNDELNDIGSNNLLDGGHGNDTLIDRAGSSLLVGGAGNDALITGDGNDVIAFNKGDGFDTVTLATGSKTLSLGGGLAYGDLQLRKSRNDLVLDTGAGEGVAFRNWYVGTANRNLLDLQIVAEAMADFDAGSADPLLNRKVQDFDFKGLVAAFDAARDATPGLTSWALIDGLMSFHLAASDGAALGGDLAYQYGQGGTLAGIGATSARQVIGEANFGIQAQTLRPLTGLQEGARLS